MKKYIVIIILIIFFLFSCNDKYSHEKFHKATREWCAFKKDTWWLYENETTGLRDCVWVGAYSSSVGYERNLKDSWEYMWITIKNTDTNRNVYIGSDSFTNSMHIAEKDIYGDTTNYYKQNILFFNEYGLIIPKSEKFKVLDTYLLNDVEYNNVVHLKCEIENEITPQSEDETFISENDYWVAKHEGIIKKILRNSFDTVTWSLINCDIKK